MQEHGAVERNGVGAVAEPEAGPANVYAVLSLVLGIVGLLVAALLFPSPGAVIGAGAVVVARVSRRIPGRRGIATAGLVTGILAVVLGVAGTIVAAYTGR